MSSRDNLTARINKSLEDDQFIRKILADGNWAYDRHPHLNVETGKRSYRFKIGVKCDDFSHLAVRLREIADDVALIASFTGE